MSKQLVGKVLAIALRDADKTVMHEVADATAIENGGLVGDPPSSPDRGVTLLASGQWKLVTDQLGANLPWWTRRANVLVEADSLAHLIGRRVQIGNVELLVIAETKPCGLMDKLHNGLRAALAPDVRAGVYGRVVKAGSFRIGDAVTLV